jgi:transposase
MVIVDNYSSPISEQVARPAQELGIHLVFLPPYSPDLNPIESLWKSVKRVLSTGFAETLDDMKQKIVSAWNAFSGQLSFAKHWIDVFLEGQNYYSNLRGNYNGVWEMVKKKRAKGFHVLPKRWIVERTLAWLTRFRRLSKDYERKPSSSEARV